MEDNLVVIGEATENEPAHIKLNLTVPENRNGFVSCLEKIRRLPYLVTSASSKLKDKKVVTAEEFDSLVEEIEKSIDLLNSTWKEYQELVDSLRQENLRQVNSSKNADLVQLICFWGLSETTEDLYHAISDIMDTYKILRQRCFWGFHLLLSWRILCINNNA